MQVLGVDIGGTGIKAAIVDTEKGQLLTERIKLRTPQPALPQAVMDTCVELFERIGWKDGPIGCGFPSIIKNNICHSANNIDKSWIGLNVGSLLQACGYEEVFVVNDADAAAIGELEFGHAKDLSGTVMLVTVGTGLGCGLIYNGQLIPNCELGSAYLDTGIKSELWASNKARKTEELDWPEYGKRLNEVLEYYERLMSVDHFILGGGMSKRYEYVEPFMSKALDIRTAAFHNAAGVIGAAGYAASRIRARHLISS